MQLELLTGKEEKAPTDEAWSAPFISIPRPVINYIGVSGGKDSTALLLWALHESGYPKESLDVTFCDTDNEHDLTYDQVVMLSEHSVEHGGPKIKWLKPERGFYEMVKHEDRFPSPQVRFCTRLLKVVPSQRHVKALIDSGNDVVIHSGIRASESLERSKMVRFEEIKPGLSEFRPLLHWTLTAIWEIHKRYGIRPNPLYVSGAGRVGCFPCIMSRKSEIYSAVKIAPGKFEKIRNEEGPRKKGKGWNTFFEYKKTPKRFRTKEITTTKGKVMLIPTIDDVVRWATENPHGRAGQPVKELDTRVEDRTMCQNHWGSCE